MCYQYTYINKVFKFLGKLPKKTYDNNFVLSKNEGKIEDIILKARGHA